MVRQKIKKNRCIIDSLLKGPGANNKEASKEYGRILQEVNGVKSNQTLTDWGKWWRRNGVNYDVCKVDLIAPNQPFPSEEAIDG